MATDTPIEWAHHTWNPWYGCTPVSEGCANCYALRRMTQLKRVSGPGDIRKASERTWKFPLSKKVKSGDRVFVCSWSDFFHPRADKWRHHALDIMVERPDVTFLLLTKRIERVGRLQTCVLRCEYDHVWLGTTAENQPRWNKRVGELMRIPWPGKKFVSLEPLLGAVDVDFCDGGQAIGPCDQCGESGANPKCEACAGLSSIDWVIAGGESGPGARPAHPEWFRGVRDQCVEAGVPFFFKQWGEWRNGSSRHVPEDHHAVLLNDARMFPDSSSGLRSLAYSSAHPCVMARLGKKRAGRVLDGRTWDEVPQ